MGIWSDIADWIGPSPNKYPGAEQRPLWVVLHIQQGSEAGTISWQRNPASKVSSHFLAPKSGRLAQMLDTADASWSVVNGNLQALSIECEGNSGDTLTADQIEAAAQVLARAHTLYGIPLAICDDPNRGAGLTGHGLGGAAWGSHFDCPGPPILAQRPQIITRAAAILGGVLTTGGKPMGNIPATIAAKWPDIAGEFPPNAPFDDSTAIIWSDAGARAAAFYARQTRDAILALTAKYTAPPPVNVDALAAALAPKLAAGATADELAHAVVMHLADVLKAG